MRTITEQEAHAIGRLVGNPDFEMYLKWLGDSSEKYLKDSIYLMSDVQLRQNQGKTQILVELVETAKGIKTILDRFKQRSAS